MTMDRHARPSPQEAAHYYHGLDHYPHGFASRPRLIACTGHDTFVGPISRSSDDRHRKWLARVGHHKIAEPWHAGALMQDVIRILARNGIKWTAVDILRLGRNIGPRENTGPRETAEIVTMIISVQPETTAWDQGQRTVDTCKARLHQLSILDVEVEMKEDVVTSTAQSPPPQQQQPQPEMVFEDLPGPKPMSLKLAPDLPYPSRPMSCHLSEFVGTSLSPANNVGVYGTKGLYLRSRSTRKVYALTCRHLLFGNRPGITYEYHGGPQLGAIQPSDKALEEMIAESPEDDPLPPPGPLQTVRARAIGHVAYSPRKALHNEVDGAADDKETPGFLCDWALVELHETRFTTPLHQLTNRAYTGAGFGLGVNKATRMEQRAATGGDADAFPLMSLPHGIDNYSMRLQGVIPITEIAADTCTSAFETIPGPGTVVMKHGSRTGFTVGIVNELVSMRRHEFDHFERTCIDWAIIPARTQLRVFADDGDSGSCFFDASGRVGGMITGSCGHVAYATPMGWLLREIWSHGYDVDIA